MDYKWINLPVDIVDNLWITFMCERVVFIEGICRDDIGED